MMIGWLPGSAEEIGAYVEAELVRMGAEVSEDVAISVALAMVKGAADACRALSGADATDHPIRRAAGVSEPVRH